MNFTGEQISSVYYEFACMWRNIGLNCNQYSFSVLMDDHKEAEAIAELSKAIVFKPDLQLLHLRAAFYDSMGDNISTIRDCEAALCLDSGHLDTTELYNKALKRVDEQQK